MRKNDRRKLTKRAAIPILFIPLTGCGSTGVVPTGENQYMISKTDIGDTWSAGDKVLAKLYREANTFCAERNSVVETISEESAPGRTFVRNASATLRFRCAERGGAK